MSGAITPRLMENTAAYPMFRKKVVAVMDSMYKPGVGLEAHVTHLVRNHDGEYASRYACTECPDPVNDPEGYKKRLEGNMVESGFHQHRSTCHHGKTGAIMCRMCYPRKVLAQSGIVQVVEISTEEGKKVVVELDEVEEKEQIEQGCSPFHPPDDRLLAFELKRPEVFF